LKEPATCGRLQELHMWDYLAMRWRDRYRIERLQDEKSASGAAGSISRSR